MQRQKIQLMKQGLTLQKYKENEKTLEEKAVEMVNANLEKKGRAVDALKVWVLEGRHLERFR